MLEGDALEKRLKKGDCIAVLLDADCKVAEAHIFLQDEPVSPAAVDALKVSKRIERELKPQYRENAVEEVWRWSETNSAPED